MIRRMEFLTPAGGDLGEVLRDALLVAGIDIPDNDLTAWTAIEATIAYDWAMRTHLAASDNRIKTYPMPQFIADARDRAAGSGQDRAHLVDLDAAEAAMLRAWLKVPEREFFARRVRLTSIEGGGIRICTVPRQAVTT